MYKIKWLKMEGIDANGIWKVMKEEGFRLLNERNQCIFEKTNEFYTKQSL